MEKSGLKAILFAGNAPPDHILHVHRAVLSYSNMINDRWCIYTNGSHDRLSETIISIGHCLLFQKCRDYEWSRNKDIHPRHKYHSSQVLNVMRSTS